jgi:hypothetical protein
MARDYGVTENENSEISLFAGEPPYKPMPITLGYTGAEVEIVRGTVLAKKDVAVGTPTYGASNTGDGTVGSITTGDGAKVGDYVLRCTAEAGNGGTFEVIDPDGNKLDDATVAVAFTSDQINFTIADGDEDWDVDDTITIPIEAGDGDYYGYDPDSVIGLQRACAILAETVTVAADADEASVAYMAGHFRKDDLTWTHTGITDAEKLAAYNQLKALGIFTEDL